MTARWNLTGYQRKTMTCESLKLTYSAFFMSISDRTLRNERQILSFCHCINARRISWMRMGGLKSSISRFVKTFTCMIFFTENSMILDCVLASCCGQFWLHFKRMINLFSMPNFSCPITKYSNIYFKTSSISSMWIIS